MPRPRARPERQRIADRETRAQRARLFEPREPLSVVVSLRLTATQHRALVAEAEALSAAADVEGERSINDVIRSALAEYFMRDVG